MSAHPEALYRVNDALTALAAEFGREVSDEVLNEVTHHVAGALGIAPAHDDPTIAAFLADGGYPSIEAWMLDSDYRFDGDERVWRTDEGHWVTPEDAIAGAIEACGFDVTCVLTDENIATEDDCATHEHEGRP